MIVFHNYLFIHRIPPSSPPPLLLTLVYLPTWKIIGIILFASSYTCSYGTHIWRTCLKLLPSCTAERIESNCILDSRSALTLTISTITGADIYHCCEDSHFDFLQFDGAVQRSDWSWFCELPLNIAHFFCIPSSMFVSDWLLEDQYNAVRLAFQHMSEPCGWA